MSLSVFAAAADVSDREALVTPERVYSFQALAACTARAVRWLAARGITRESPRPVALLGASQPEAVVALLALLGLGAEAVMIHPRLLPAERAVLLADAEPALFIDEAALRELGALLDGDGDGDGDASAAWPALPDPPDAATAAILYTSGTTGVPKGARLSRRALLAAARASEQNLGFYEGDRWLLAMPLAHVGGLSIVTRCLLARRAVVLPAWHGPFAPEALAQQIAAQRVTLLSLVPTQLARLLALPGWRPPPALRAVLLGGAAASEALVARAAERGVPVLCTYGLTEACSQVTSQSLADPVRAGSGRPLPGAEVRILDDQIQIRGPMLFDGYHRRGAPPQLPLTADGWFATGDLGRLDADGSLHVLARRTDLIVTGGENVYPIEVEQALERCPGVLSACVFGVADEAWGQRVAAALVLAPDADAGAVFRGVRALVLGQLAPHKRPRLVAQVDALAVTGAGKLDRAATARQAAGGLRELAGV